MASDLLSKLRRAAMRAAKKTGPPCKVCAQPEVRARIVALESEGLRTTAIVAALKEVEGVDLRADRVRSCLREHGR